jgi:uncharacterized protein YndB with AHSA1/START domain
MQYTYSGPRRSITIKRHFKASPERVFDAWVNPEIASKWLMMTKSSRNDYTIDLRVGGLYTIARHSANKVYIAVGQYLEIDRPHRLVFTFGMPQFAADFDTVTVEIKPDGSGSLLTLTQAGMRPGYEKSTIKGWGSMFLLLDAALKPVTAPAKTPIAKAKPRVRKKAK